MNYLNLIQNSNTNIEAGTDLTKHRYSYKQVVAIIEEKENQEKQKIAELKKKINKRIEEEENCMQNDAYDVQRDEHINHIEGLEYCLKQIDDVSGKEELKKQIQISM